MVLRPALHWKGWGICLCGGTTGLGELSANPLSLSERPMPSQPPQLPGAAFLCRGGSFSLRPAYISLWVFDKVE